MRNAQAVSRRALIASFAAASLGLVGSRAIRAQNETSSVQMDAVAVVERVRSSVVTVVNEQVGQNPFRSSTMPQEVGRGTGFIIDELGHIVTNEHVVRSGDAFEVILANGERRQAELVGKDPFSDLAVIRMDGGEIPATLAFGDSDALRVGQPVLAIGSPLGEFTNTVTDGIVSALNRDFPGAANQGFAAYSNLVQHDAAINPGNSGGPLVDAEGQIIGVNTLGIPEVPGLGTPVQGIFFAIPSNVVREITNQLIQSGRVAYPYLGVEVQPITQEIASQFDLPADHGVYVMSVGPNTPAEQAGIQQEDIITAMAGQTIDQDNAFAEVLFGHQPGDVVDVTVVRGDQEQQIQVTLAERPTV